MISDPISHMKDLLDELIVTRAMFEKVEQRLIELENITEENAHNWEELYEKQFEFAIRLNGIHGDMNRVAKRYMNDDNKFQLKRMLQEADKIYEPLVVEI